MASFSTYTGLKTAITDWMDRNDIEGNAADFIALAEAGLNRELETVEVDASISGVVDNRAIDVTSLSVREPVALFILDQSQEYEVTKKPAGSFEYSEISSFPSLWALDGTNIKFDCPLNSAYSFRFRYSAQFALSDETTTNWLLTNHPDVYLSACIAWGAKFVADDTTLARYAGPIDGFIASINRQESKRKKGKLGVDPALVSIGRRGSFLGW
jgi:hypothetical protein